ncbi:hypothetical protein C1925_00590 [Stenotrophomonas sp. SAU14A_NAIMI4_5]|uniref:DUF7684 family protein n=1 Tax=Stenotrophomonas sp. SAU14A_NAIMI4_5 TaxID=2072413 RepID=UPI000D53D26B|nr:hypothetical protein [Stenotrophomonas sp. SAU14A_NAIMI4_5]AWH47766.1 hypothetical protein C1925_00590 [Stenotrophomonas sp. SAU14A_NAIMI4_5]
MDGTVEYLWLPPDAIPPERTRSPYRAIVAVEIAVEAEWQARVSDWLVRSGCRYMMAWGIECSGWDDAVDMASLEGEGADVVMTTWHERDTLAEVFAFCAIAQHPMLELPHTLVLHVAGVADRARVLAGVQGAVAAGA